MRCERHDHQEQPAPNLVGALLATLLGGCLDRKGVICPIIILLATVYFANQIAWTWEIYEELKAQGHRIL